MEDSGGVLWSNQVDAAAREVLTRRGNGGASSSGVNGVLKLGRQTEEEDARRRKNEGGRRYL